MVASLARRIGSVSPAGEALATLPPIVPRFWIWAAPIVAAASTSAGRGPRDSARRRGLPGPAPEGAPGPPPSGGFGCASSGAEDEGALVEGDATERVDAREV